MHAVVRRVTPQDLPQVAELLALATPGSPKSTASTLAWRYPQLARPDVPGSWVTVVDGRIVAHSGAIVHPVALGGRTGTGVFGADAATHPAHRRRGYFSAAATARLREARQLGALVSWSVPNDASVRALQAAGLGEVGTGRLRFAASVGSALALVPRRGSNRLDPADPVEDPLPAVATLYREPDAGVLRRADWWRWRYLERPDRSYLHLVARDGDRVVGVAAATVVRRRGISVGALCDWHVTGVPALHALLRGASHHLAVAAIGAICLPGTRPDRVLSHARMVRLPRILEPQPLRVLADHDLGGWELSWGELDWV